MNFQQVWCHCFYKDIAGMGLRGVLAHVFYKEIAAMRLKSGTLWMLATIYRRYAAQYAIRNMRTLRGIVPI